MTFEEIVDQALAMLERRGRVAYRTLKRQFQLDDDALEDLKIEIIRAHANASGSHAISPTNSPVHRSSGTMNPSPKSTP